MQQFENGSLIYRYNFVNNNSVYSHTKIFGIVLQELPQEVLLVYCFSASTNQFWPFSLCSKVNYDEF